MKARGSTEYHTAHHAQGWGWQLNHRPTPSVPVIFVHTWTHLKWYNMLSSPMLHKTFPCCIPHSISVVFHHLTGAQDHMFDILGLCGPCRPRFLFVSEFDNYQLPRTTTKLWPWFIQTMHSKSTTITIRRIIRRSLKPTVYLTTNNVHSGECQPTQGRLMRSGLQLSGDAPHRLGTPQHGNPNAQWKQTRILHNTRKQTDLYSSLPYTESTGQST